VPPETTTLPSVARRRTSPRTALVATIALAFLLYGGVASLVQTPRIFYDELIYMEAAASLADGDGLEVRGERYAYGALYPALISPLLALAPDREVAYALVKLANALLFALTAIPAYLVARRLLEPWPSAGVAALAILVPSSVYVTVVMTESLAYLVSTSAILAIVLALERPSVVRQLTALVVVGLAILTRAQFLLLYAAFLAALVAVQVVLPQRRELSWRGLGSLWPAGASLVAGLALFVLAPLLRGDDPEDALGGYEALFRTYDAWNLVQWVVWHAAGLELYLAVVAVAVAPVVLTMLYRRAREGSTRPAAFLAAFVFVNAAALLVTAIVVTFQDLPDVEISRLHDRYLFYVVPLWLVVLVWWLTHGSPRPRTATRVGAGLALGLTLLFPYWQLDLENGVKLFSAVGTALPAALKELGGSTIAGAIVTIVAVAALLAAVLRREGGARRLVVGVLVAVFVLNGLLVWGRAFNPLENAVFAGGLERRWIDERVPDGATVTMLESSCEDAVLERDSYFLTEFFNGSVEDVVALTREDPAALVDADGAVLLDGGRPLEAEYVVVQPGVRLEGTELGSGTAAGLTLWRVPGTVRIATARVEPPQEGFCLPWPS
jgi:Dolichyl-phosphate-mannose-protein mannosyltransferase